MALSNGMARGTIDEETLNPLDGGLLESEERWDSEVGNTTTFADFDLVSASCSSRRAHRTRPRSTITARATITARMHSF